MYICFDCEANFEEPSALTRDARKETGAICCPHCGNLKPLTIKDMKFMIEDFQSSLRKLQRRVSTSGKLLQEAEANLIKAQGRLRTMSVLEGEVEELKLITQKSYCALHNVYPNNGEPCWACVEKVIGI